MTVILGYINSNKKNSISALFSDNLESNGKERKIVDKIRKVDDRFVLGILGLGLVNWIIDDWIKYFEEYENSYHSYSSIEELSEELETGINFCINYWKTKNIITDDYMEQYRNYPSSIVILDNKEQKLYYLELGKILVDRCEIKLKELDKGILYEFGVSAADNTKGYIENCYNCFDKEETILFMKEHIRELHSIYKNEIGLLGCYYLEIDINSSFVSSFSDKEVLIKNKFCC